MENGYYERATKWNINQITSHKYLIYIKVKVFGL